MQRKKTLIEILHETFHRSKKTPYEIAEEMGEDYNYLCRSVLSTPSGVNFPIKWLIPLMKITKNYNVLHRIANICGFLLVKVPKGVAKFKDTDRQVNEYQKHFAESISALLDFINNPNTKTYDVVNIKLLDHLSETVYWRKRCEKGLLNQSELFEEPENE